jgi:hypothetical protein
MAESPDWDNPEAVAEWVGKPPQRFYPYDPAAVRWIKRLLVLWNHAAREERHPSYGRLENPRDAMVRWFIKDQAFAVVSAEHGNWEPLARMRRFWKAEVRREFNLQYSDRTERLSADFYEGKIRRAGRPRGLDPRKRINDHAANTVRVIEHILWRQYGAVRGGHQQNAATVAAQLFKSDGVKVGTLLSHMHRGKKRPRPRKAARKRATRSS